MTPATSIPADVETAARAAAERLCTLSGERSRAHFVANAWPVIAAAIMADRAARPAARLGLTAKQQEAFDYLRLYIAEFGGPPSYEEMARELGLKSKSGMHRMILALEERGYIRRLPGKARAIEVLA